MDPKLSCGGANGDGDGASSVIDLWLESLCSSETGEEAGFSSLGTSSEYLLLPLAVDEGAASQSLVGAADTAVSG